MKVLVLDDHENHASELLKKLAPTSEIIKEDDMKSKKVSPSLVAMCMMFGLDMPSNMPRHHKKETTEDERWEQWKREHPIKVTQ